MKTQYTVTIDVEYLGCEPATPEQWVEAISKALETPETSPSIIPTGKQIAATNYMLASKPVVAVK